MIREWAWSLRSTHFDKSKHGIDVYIRGWRHAGGGRHGGEPPELGAPGPPPGAKASPAAQASYPHVPPLPPPLPRPPAPAYLPGPAQGDASVVTAFAHVLVVLHLQPHVVRAAHNLLTRGPGCRGRGAKDAWTDQRKEGGREGGRA